MSEKDKEYVKWAESLSYRDWVLIDTNKVESEEAKRILHGLIVRGNHKEEARNGDL